VSTLVIVGAQWGDEGKGKVVDFVAARAGVVARYSGGNNAGHTLVRDGHKIVTHLVPSGCLYPGTTCVLGAGMVVDVDVLEKELAELRAMNLLTRGELRVSTAAHLVFPWHRALDGAREDRARARAIGTTRRGMGPTYEAKAARRGIRVRDLFDETSLRERIAVAKDSHDLELRELGQAPIDPDASLRLARRWAGLLEPMLCDAGALCCEAIAAGKHVLFEGAQGALLDLDHGTYPFVTSSSTVAGGVCTGIGIGPTLIDAVWGISKAYATRVGAGPFPSKVEGAVGDALREAGAEYGATTGRPRDCGWLDLPALRYAARLSGMTGLAITKLDVLAELPRAFVCTAYEDGVDPGRDGLAHAVARVEEIAGWSAELAPRVRQARTLGELPPPVRAYLDMVERAVEVPIALVSVGAEREQTITLAQPFERA
jgi:adenylosuccinate synthase